MVLRSMEITRMIGRSIVRGVLTKPKVHTKIYNFIHVLDVPIL